MHRDQVSPVLWVGSVLMSTFLPIIIFPRKALFGVKAPQKAHHTSPPHRTARSTYLSLSGTRRVKAARVRCVSSLGTKYPRASSLLRYQIRWRALETTPPCRTCLWQTLISYAGLTSPRQLSEPPASVSAHTDTHTRGTTCPRCRTAHKELLCRAATHGIPR